MNNITHRPFLRTMGILLMILWSLGIKAQTANNPVLTWDQEVGCITYDNKDEQHSDYLELLESIEEGPCIRFCEYSTVNYTFTANNVQQVTWEVAGGNLTSSSNTNATIHWGNSGNGSLMLTVIYTDNTVAAFTICIEKILKPRAYFDIDGPDPHQKDFCVGTSISFNNLSTQNGGSAIVSYLWDFGDGNYSNTFEPIHTFTTPGIYTVMLTVTNSCNCSDKYKMELYISKKKVVDISCASVVCELSTETYSVNDDCEGIWRVEGGTIVANNGASIDVVWNQVNPAEGFGYVSYLSNCSCPYWNTIKIPVILDQAEIMGPEVICEGKQDRFTLPQWPTTDFQWEIDGDPDHPMLANTDQRNEVFVEGATPGTYTLEVKYHNTLINSGTCEGYAKIEFTVVENIEILTDDALTICTDSSKTFSSHNGMSVNWEIRRGNTVVYTDSGSTISYVFNTAGLHIITANNNGCISDPIMVDVIAKPIITGSISGPEKVCLNLPYTYEINEDEPGAIYVWSVSSGSGSVVGNNAGTQADFVFTSPTATISVVKQFVKNGVICQSDPVYYNLNQIVVDATIINNSGLSLFCPSSSVTFTADLNAMNVDHLHWEVVGIPSGTTNFGNIIDGINGTTVTVSFNEISSGISTGELRLYITKCSVKTMFSYPIQLITMPTLTLAPIQGICPTSNAIEIEVTTSNGLPASVQVSYNGGPFTGNYPFTSGVPFTINNQFTNYTDSNIAQTLTVKLANMCTYTPTASQTLTIYPLTQIDITPGYGYVVCPTSYLPFTLYANISTGITPSVNYNWFKQGDPLPLQSGTNSNFIISGPNPGGIYYVEVTDENGCIVTSEEIEVLENCSNGGGAGGSCTGPIDPAVTMTAGWNSCGAITATVYSPTYTPTSIHWTGSQHITIDPLTQNTPNAVFTTSVPGVHIVKAIITYNDCTITKITTVVKHYEPKVNAAITCNDGNYTVKLLNNSIIFGIDFNAIDVSFSGPGITGPTVGDTYTINAVTPGTYTYTMTLSSAGNPDCTVPISLSIDPDPDTNFSLASSYCSESPVTLSIPGGVMQPDYEYRWVFNDTSYVASSIDTDINFAVEGSYDIVLKITNQYGCVFTSSDVTATINKAKFNGTIAPNPADFCEGSVIALSFNPTLGTSTPSDMIWMRDEVQVGTGLSYLPTQSGSYWPVLIDADGCKDYNMSLNPRIVKVRKPPFASISGNTSLCYGTSTRLTGIFTDNDVEHRWTLNGMPIAGTMGTWTTGSTNIALDLSGLSPGSYDYGFEVRPITDPSCSNSFTVTVVAHPEVIPPVITYTTHLCQPYTLLLTASGPSLGTYNWSNGATGQSIYVTQGGAYSVTFTAPTGCKATGYTQAPHNPERALWVVPNGCYSLCPNNGEYLLGPLGTYQGYEWTINGATSQSGNNTFVHNQPITMTGYYQLAVTQQGCTFESNMPHITSHPECDVKPCKIEGEIRGIVPKDDYYFLSIYFNNPHSYPITINLSSLNSYGTYSPSAVTLPPGGSWVTPIYFYPNSTFYPGAGDGLIIQIPGCMDIWDLNFPEKFHPKSKEKLIESPLLVLSPNPAYETASVSYTIGTEYQDAQSITIYDVMGIQRAKQKISGKQGEVHIDVRQLTSGVYIINLEADGKRIATEKLIKK